MPDFAEYVVEAKRSPRLAAHQRIGPGEVVGELFPGIAGRIAVGVRDVFDIVLAQIRNDGLDRLVARHARGSPDTARQIYRPDGISPKVQGEGALQTHQQARPWRCGVL
jgi:hypothetical protein